MTLPGQPPRPHNFDHATGPPHLAQPPTGDGQRQLRQGARKSLSAVRSVTSRSTSYVASVTREHNVLAVVALVVAAVGLATFICAPIGAVMGHIARRQVRQRNQSNGGMATAAVIIGWGITALYSVGLVCSAAFILTKGIAILRFLS